MMLGRSLAAAFPPLRHAILKVWGYPDVDARQKWHAVWPQLALLPTIGLTVLDAGCGTGAWTLELAARRPGWRVVGIDRDNDAIQTAELMRRRLQLDNAQFIQSEFLSFHPSEQYDVVLSVSAAHYLAMEGRGPQLFDQFRNWLSRGGRLVLLGPRSRDEAPFAVGLPQPPWHPVFRLGDLAALSRTSGLFVKVLRPVTGRLGTLAKQLAAVRLGRLTYPIQLCLDALDRLVTAGQQRSSLMWLLVASRAE